MHELGKFIQGLMDQASMDRAELVRRSGLSRQHVSDLLTNEKLTRLPKAETFDALHRGFPGVPRNAFVLKGAEAIGIPVDPVEVDFSKLSNETLLGILAKRLEVKEESWDAGNTSGPEDELARRREPDFRAMAADHQPDELLDYDRD